MSNVNPDCARKWWTISAAVGVVVAFIAWAIIGIGWFGSIVLGVIVGGVMGYVTVRSQCEETGETRAPGAGAAPAGQAHSGRTQPRGAGVAAPGAGTGASSGTVAGGSGTAAPEPEPAQASRPDDAASEPAESPRPAGDEAPITAPGALDAPRGGSPDDLKRIKGVGPKIEGILNEMGIHHFDQIAAWSEEDVARVDDHLNFRGRIAREDWIGQARKLAAGEGEG